MGQEADGWIPPASHPRRELEKVWENQKKARKRVKDSVVFLYEPVRPAARVASTFWETKVKVPILYGIVLSRNYPSGCGLLGVQRNTGMDQGARKEHGRLGGHQGTLEYLSRYMGLRTPVPILQLHLFFISYFFFIQNASTGILLCLCFQRSLLFTISLA